MHYSRLKRNGVLETVRNFAVADESGQTCNVCKEYLPFSEFPPARRNKSLYAGQCKVCKLVKNYSITRLEYETMLSDQSNKCLLCKRLLVRNGRGMMGPHIDHDHKCCNKKSISCGNCIRGILCGKCNYGLGMFDENVEALKNSIMYLEGNL